MFDILDNKFLENNTCKYIDEYQNTAFFKRTESGFVAKLRFADKNIKASPMNVILYDEKIKEEIICILNLESMAY